MGYSIWFGDDEPGERMFAELVVLEDGERQSFGILEAIWVRKDLRGNGHASRLLSEVIGHCRTSGISELYAHPSPSNKQANKRRLAGVADAEEEKRLNDTYDRWGFSRCDIEARPVGFDRVLFINSQKPAN